jgi:hypothetical protein
VHLIGPLAAGIAGCESGSFDIVLRGTSTPASYYTDFEGLTSPITGTGVALDARGGGIFYVNSLVKVTAKNSLGATVRQFIAGDASTAVEVRSDSFTGTHYQSGAVAASNPTTLAAVLDLVNNSFGTTNWQVLYGGSSVNLSTALATLAGLKNFVVTDPAYGAVGNGIADDRSAINAAIAAANAAGGGVVFFPPGTYRITNALTCFTTVALVANSASLTSITLDHATNALLSGVAPRMVQNITFGCAQAHTGAMFSITSAVIGQLPTVFDNCVFSGAATVGTWVQQTTSAYEVRFSGCHFGLNNTETGVSWTGLAAANFIGCRFTGPTGAGTITAISADNMVVTGCVVDFQNVTSGTLTVFDINSGHAVIVGNKLRGPSTTTATFTMFDASHASAFMYEAGNSLQHAYGIYSATHKLYNLAAGALTISQLGSRLHNVVELGTTLSNADPIVVPALDAATIVLQNTSTAAHSGNVGINLDAAPPGAALDLFVWNNGAAASVTYQWGTNVASTATFTVATDTVRTFRLVSASTPGTRWRLISDAAGSELAEV